MFDVEISMVVTKNDDGLRRPYASYKLDYSRLPLEGVIAFEGLMNKLSQQLTDLGVAFAPMQGADQKQLAAVQEFLKK